MNEFINFFNKTASDYPMHLEIYYSKIMDWTIRIWKKMDKDIEIVNIQDCDVDLAFAKAQVQLKEWLLENEGEY